MKSEEVKPIQALFEVIRVQNMASGSIRVVLEADETRTDLLSILADVKRGGGLLESVMLPVLPNEDMKREPSRFIDGR